ncbi:hypothetical protein Ahy_A06g030010 isoform A [Arachis hypogaea]|uniref:Uncharacterized protein n=1 Tax=Arachis hypogaea TaxID=3818 RepID=A0A445CUV5_ARAHY|nr:hypothetical protein Ahy_A06g030010 isoform A [Arachis hypogaea]
MNFDFFHRTVVVRVENPNYSLEPFCLKSIPKLLAAEKKDPRDIITSKGKETKHMMVVIADLDLMWICMGVVLRSNNNLDCVLFGDMVDHILLHLEYDRIKPLIVVSIQSHFDVSKICVNPDMKEVHDFQNSFFGSVRSNSVRISQVSSHGVQSGVVVKSIEDALNSTEWFDTYLSLVQKGPIKIGGTIVSINIGNNDWFYKLCRKCPKKVETPIEN